MGLRGALKKTSYGDRHWFVYEYQHKSSNPIIFDQEHDRFEWVSVREAIRRCKPDRVSAQIAAFASAHGQYRNARAIGKN